MDEETSRHPSKLLLKLFQEAWKELCAERGEADPITTIQIETRDGEKKNVNGFEFWQQMIEEVEKQNDDPDYLFYSPIDEEKIENLFTTSAEPPPGGEPAFYMKGKYYIPRISNSYLQNLNLEYDQWLVTQDISLNPKIIKIVRRKRYVSPSSTDDEIMLELIFATKISEKMEKEMLENKKKDAEEKEKDVEKDSENMEVNIIHEKPEIEEFKNPDTELDSSEIIKMDALVKTEDQQFNIADLEYVKTIQTIESVKNQADELEKQQQAFEKGHIYMEEMIEIEDPKETKQMSEEKFEASSRIDLSSSAEEEDEAPEETEQTSEQRELGISCLNDLASCLEDVDAVPKQTEQLPYEKGSEASYSTDLDRVSDVPLNNTTHVQVARNTYQDTVWRDLRPNIATQNVNPQNLSISMNYRNVVTSPHIPLMRPIYGRTPFFIQPSSFRKPVFPYKFCNPYYGHGLRHLLRNPFSFRPQLPFIPLPTHRVPRALLQDYSRPQTALLPRMPPRLLFPYLPLIPPPSLVHTGIYHQTILNSGFPPFDHQTQRASYGDSAEINQQILSCPSINPSSQWTPQSKPVIIHNPNIIPNYDPENVHLAHEQPRIQITPDIPPNEDILNLINAVPAHLSNINTTLASRKKVVQDITNESPWEYIVIIKRKSGQTQLIAQAPLSSIIPLPDGDIEDGNPDAVQSSKCVLIEKPSITVNPKKSALRRHNVKRNQRRRSVHFSRSVTEKEKMKSESAQSKNLTEKSNEDKSDYQPETSVDEREYLQTPSIFEILNSRKDADPNEPQKVPTNYMEDVIQRKERRWKSMDVVPGSPSLDLILDMIRKDNEMLEDEERLQREQEAQQIGSPSTARQTDYEKFERMYNEELLEMYQYEAYEGTGDLVENAYPEITLDLPESTKELQSPEEITVSNPSDAGVILNINPENVTALEHQELESPKETIVLNPPDVVDILNPSPETVLEHALQDFSGFEETDLDETNELIQLTVHVDPSNIREFEDVLHKSDEKVSLSACDEIQQKVETISVLPSADIEYIQEYPSTSQPLETGTIIHMVEKLKIEIDEEEMALLNNLTTSNERFNLGVLLPDCAVLNLKEKFSEKLSKSYKSDAGASRENLAAIISPNQTLVKKPEKSSFLFPKKSQTSTNESHTQANKSWWKISKRETSVSLENLGGKLDQISTKKPEKSSSMSLEKTQIISKEIPTQDNKNWWKANKRETSVSVEDLGATSRLDQTIIKLEKSSSLFPEKSQTSGNESQALANKNWWKTTKREHSVSLDNLGATSSLDQTSTASKRSQISSDKDSAPVDKYWWKTTKRETSVSLENLGGNLDQPINKMMRSSEESSSELATDKNETYQLIVTKDQATQTIDIDDTDENLDVAVNTKDEFSQTDEEIEDILSYAAAVRNHK